MKELREKDKEESERKRLKLLTGRFSFHLGFIFISLAGFIFISQAGFILISGNARPTARFAETKIKGGGKSG